MGKKDMNMPKVWLYSMRLDTFADNLGVKRELTETERHDFAEQIGEIKGIVDLAAGDLINQECKALGLAYINNESDPKNFFGLLPLIESMGYKFSTAAEHATVARAWTRGDRVGGLAYGHYKAVQGCNGTGDTLTRGQAIQILQEAQMGYKDKKGNHIQPCPPSWVKKRRASLEGKAKPTVELEAQQQQHDIVSTIVPEVEKAIKATGITARKATSLVNKVEKEIKKAHADLSDTFTTAVNDEVQKRLSGEKAKLAKLIKETTEQKKIYEEAIKGAIMPITLTEYRSLVQFCHPDKHLGNEEKATKAHNLITTLGKRLKYLK